MAAKDKAATVEGDKRAKRALRWSMNFNTRDGADYLRQLEALGAILAVPAGANHYKVVDLSKHPYQPEDRDLSTIQRVWWIDGNAQSVANLMAAMGLPDRPPRVIAFIPQELENELAKKELDYQGIKEDEIFETRFQVFGAGGKYDVRVVGQKRK